MKHEKRERDRDRETAVIQDGFSKNTTHTCDCIQTKTVRRPYYNIQEGEI